MKGKSARACLLLVMVAGAGCGGGPLPVPAGPPGEAAARPEQGTAEEPAAGGGGERSALRLVLSLPEAIRYAEGHNPRLVSARLEQEKARGRIVSARSGGLPQLSLSASYVRLDEAGTIDVPGVGSMVVGNEDNYRASLSLSQPIYVGGKVRGAMRIARLYERSTEASGEAARRAVVFEVTRAYYGLVLAEKRVRMMEEQLRLARSHLEDAESRYREGAALRLHVIRARAAVSRAESGLIRARGGLEAARRALLVAIGAPLAAEVELTDDLPEPGTLEVPQPPSLEELRSRRPDIAALEAHIAMQQENLRIVAGDLRPTVAAFGEYGWEKPPTKSFGELDWSDYWQAGVRLSWTLYDGGAVRGRLIEERAALAQMQTELAEKLRAARREVLDAVSEIEAAGRLVEACRGAVLEAEEALRLARAAYDAGTASQVELLDAQAGLTSARIAYAEARYSYAMAWAAYRLAAGTTVGERSAQ